MVTVDAVTVSLVSDLDAHEWILLSPLGFYGVGARWHPEIVFPWTPLRWKRYLQTKSNRIINAEAGSEVFLLGGADSPLDIGFADLDDPANTERKLRMVAVRHADGSVEVAKQPLQFLRAAAVASLIEVGDYYGAFRGMLARVSAALELPVDDIEQMASAGDLTLSKHLPAIEARSMKEAIVALSETHRDLDGHAMAAFGYMIGRAEAEVQLLGPARVGVKSQSSLKKAALARHQTARAASEPVREQARMLIRKNPKISLTACARDIAKTRSEDQSWIHRQIKELFVPKENGRGFRPRSLEE